MPISNLLSPYSSGTALTTPSSLKKNTGLLVAPAAKAAPKPTVSSVKPAASSSSIGSYKGTAITPGTDAQVQSQIRDIDSRGSTPGLLTPGISSLSSSVRTPSSPTKSSKTSSPVTYSGLVGDIKAASEKVADTGKMTREERAARLNLAKIPGISGDIKQRFAEWTAGNEEQAIPLEFQQGRGQVMQRLEAARLDALGQTEQALSQGVNALATERGVNTGAYKSAADVLGTAAGYAQPSPAEYGKTVFNPLTGQYEGGGGDQLVSGWADYLAAGGDPSQVPSTVSGNAVLWQQTLQAAKAKNPNFDVNTAQGTASARQNTAGLTAGLAGNQANTAIIQQGTQEVANMEAALKTADQNVQNLLKIMQDSGINNYSLVPLNSLANKVRANLSDSAVLQYQTLLAGTRALLTSVFISRGLAPTDAAANAEATLARSTTVQALFDQYNAAKSEASNLIANKKLQIQQAQGSFNGGGETTKINGVTYKKVQGGWQRVQ